MISKQSNPAGQEETTSETPAVTAANMDQNAAEFRFNVASGFGSHLRAVREVRGLDLETCGHALRLPVRVLRQLENNEFDGIDYQIYLEGYIRKYARYLDIDEAETETAIAGLKPSQPPLVATGGVSHSRYLLDRYATAATYMVLTLVIAVPIVWLGMRGTLTHDVSHLAPLDAAPVAQQDAPPPIPASPGSTAKVPVGNVDALAQATPAAPISAASVVHPAEQQPLLASMVPVPNLDSDVNITPPSGNAGDPTSVGSGNHSLTLSLPNSSWVEVIGKDGSRLEYGLLPAGTAKTYHSDQPLEVRIGNATGAQVNVDDQPVTLDAYRRANVAHFRVDIQDGKAAPTGA
ncbi:helix-turn-helix domain-containing protein [Dyella sp. M7H15-1]|uniref:helix-turn-helix domain-containing protein n=1 Tax=Dyella sp. M7H15-1 TaxID=2501295 RepID=UPI00100503D8|nr:helix-turn-helix domain-containing protein [Dyella sp. M7H15-1]QAU22720.1 helix-turn-helix domain-containing protein [Dyella sp. M7H15-1]